MTNVLPTAPPSPSHPHFLNPLDFSTLLSHASFDPPLQSQTSPFPLLPSPLNPLSSHISKPPSPFHESSSSSSSSTSSWLLPLLPLSPLFKPVTFCETFAPYVKSHAPPPPPPPPPLVAVPPTPLPLPHSPVPTTSTTTHPALVHTSISPMSDAQLATTTPCSPDIYPALSGVKQGVRGVSGNTHARGKGAGKIVPSIDKVEERRRKNRESSSRCYYNRKRVIEELDRKISIEKSRVADLYDSALELRHHNARLKKEVVVRGIALPTKKNTAAVKEAAHTIVGRGYVAWLNNPSFQKT